MTEDQVEALLGKPDFIGHFDEKQCPLAWLYGCTGPRKLPLLGSIWFNDQHLTIYPFPGDWPPPAPNLISEEDLRKAMQILDQAPGNDPVDPGATIRVVNALLPFGKTKILASIREYIRVVNDYRRPDLSLEWKEAHPTASRPREAMYEAGKMSAGLDNQLTFLLRVLFDFPSTANASSGDTSPIPIPMIGALAPPPPFDRTLAPRYPVVIIGDVPLLELNGILLAGMPESLRNILPLFEQRGRLRPQPLRPTDHPETLLGDLKSSPQWLFDKRYRIPKEYSYGNVKSGFQEFDSWLSVEMQQIIKRQILELLAPVYPNAIRFEPPYDSHRRGFRIEADLSQWDAIMADLKLHPVRWNPETDEFERHGSR